MTGALQMLYDEVRRGHVNGVERRTNGARVVRVNGTDNQPRWAFIMSAQGRWYYAGPWVEWLRGTALPPVPVRHSGLVEWLEENTKGAAV